MKNRFSKICKRIAAFVAAIIVGLPSTASLVPVSAADKLVNEYDSTNVIMDLGEVVVDSLALEAASANKGADPKLYTVAEYCYSGNKTITDARYGLYIYVYNPGAIAIETGVTANTVNMAVSYGEDGQPNAYENLPMKYCGTTGGKYTNLIYKFRVLDSDKVLAAANMSLSDGGERRYDIASIDLLHIGEHLQKSYAISKTFYYSGFAKGCGAGAEAMSTLMCRYEELQTIDIEVNHAVYRHSEPFKATEQINTVYFGIDENFFDEETGYGELKKIKAEWWEYLTKYMFVTSDEDAYNALMGKIGEDIGAGTGAENSWRVLWNETTGCDLKDNPYWDVVDDLSNNHAFRSGYNVPAGFFVDSYTDEGDANDRNIQDYGMYYDYTNYPDVGFEQYPCIDWLFWAGDVENLEDYNIPRDKVIDYMEKYTAKEGGASVGGLTNKYSAALFEDYIDEYRRQYLVNDYDKNGHCMWEFDIENEADWNWVRFDAEEYRKDLESKMILVPFKGYVRKYTDEEIDVYVQRFEEMYTTRELAPFIVLDGTGDTKGWDTLGFEDFGEKYKIGKNDAETVFNACKKMKSEGKFPVLFRFSVTNYMASPARFDLIEGPNDCSGEGLMSEKDGYVAQQSVFLNFRIISFTFFDGDTETVLGVASDPIDIINGLDAPSGLHVPDKETDWLYVIKTVFIILALAVFAFVVIKVFLKLRQDWNLGNK